MGNSNTEHSRSLRQKTSADFNKKNYKQKTIIFDKKKDEGLLKEIEEKGHSFNSVVLEILRNYFKK